MVKRINQPKFSWDRVDKRGEDDCWEWTGSRNRWGYGACQYGGKCVNASRAAYIDSFGEILGGLVVCHKCDNPACCNPRHLFAAAQADNLTDCRNKGRARYLYGSGHPRPTAKLSEDDVRLAKKLYASGVTQTSIARQMGVNSATISRAVRGYCWAHLK